VCHPDIIYNWQNIIKAPLGAVVFVCEGEKNAEALIRLGFYATTVISHKWTRECAAALTGFNIIILEDHDHNGRLSSADARKHLADFAKSIRIVPTAHLWPHLPQPKELIETYDIGDWLGFGGDHTKLIELCKQIPEEGTKLTLLDMAKWDIEPAPEQEWAIKDRVPRRVVTMFTGPGAAGKSLSQLHCSIAAVLGKEWFGMEVANGPSLFVDAEDEAAVLQRRGTDILRYYGNTWADVQNHLHLVSLYGEDAVLAYAKKSGMLETTALYKHLLEMAGDLKPSIIGLASSSDTFAGSEIDRAEVKQFIARLTRIAIAGNSGFVLIAHPSLAGMQSGSGISGSTGWHNSVRARFYLTPKDEGEDEEQRDTGLRELQFKKNNYGPIADSIALQWQNGLFVPVGGAGITGDARMETAKAVFMQILRRYEASNRIASHLTGRNYAPHLFKDEPEAKLARCSKANLKAAMLALMAAGEITNLQSGPASRRVNTLSTDGAAF
jgi:RecA-family ATPase